MKASVPRHTLLILSGLSVAIASAAPKIEEQDLGPADPEAKYVASAHGGHLAVVARKGSRVNVIVDGTAGPRVDEVVMMMRPWVDPRPLSDEAKRANTQPANLRPATYVAFSPDGQRHAYVARISQEWVLIVDGKETGRYPIPGGNVEVRLEFTPDNKHLLFARATPDGAFELIVDGQRWPGVFSSTGSTVDDSTDPLISPDGLHIAYYVPAMGSGGKEGLVVDGKDAGYVGRSARFTPDSKHLVSIGKAPKGETLQIDGKPLGTASRIVAVYVPVTGANRIIAVLPHENPDHTTGYVLLVDGKIVPATLSQNVINKVVFSPDGKHYAAICGKPGLEFVVADGKKGQEYVSIGRGGFPSMAEMRYSPDSAKLVYVATASNKHFVVINDEESDAAFDATPSFTFSTDGKRIAYTGNQNGQQRAGVFVDGKAERLSSTFDISNLKFSSDGSRYAYHIGSARDGGPLYADGKETGLTGKFTFSSDSKSLAVVGYRGSDNRSGIFINGDLAFATESNGLVRQSAFTPDGQHLFCMIMEPAKGPKAAPGAYEWVTYLDGNVVARFDRSPVAELIFGGSVAQFLPDNPGWQVGEDGVLTAMGPIGDTVKRIRVTPSADTSIATMLAQMKAPPQKKK